MSSPEEVEYVSRDFPVPLGFPNCDKCFYLQQGSPEVCIECAHQTIRPLTEPLCPICAQQVAEGSQCKNVLCSNPSRSIDCIEAIAKYDNPLKSAIIKLKDGRQEWWASIFGRLVLGYLDTKQKYYTAIVPNPTYMEKGDGHTELVIKAAMTEDVQEKYNFYPSGLSLLRPKKSRGNTFAEKKAAAEELAEILVISTELSLDGGRVLVYDDVCTSGYQLDAIARRLKGEGAVSVTGLVLARTTWR